jgi:hypothetical protein
MNSRDRVLHLLEKGHPREFLDFVLPRPHRFSTNKTAREAQRRYQVKKHRNAIRINSQ